MDVGGRCVTIRLVLRMQQSSANSWDSLEMVYIPFIVRPQSNRIMTLLSFLFLGAIALGGAFYGEGTGPIYLDDTECTSNHTNLLECFESVNAANIGEHNCQHSEDVSVICPGKLVRINPGLIRSSMTCIIL